MLETKQDKITVEELFNMELEDGYFYELINGNIVKKQAPSPLHQKAVSNLLTFMNFHTLSNRLGQCYTAPIDVFFDKYNNTQPDILLIKKDRQFIVTKNGIEGQPDLVVEVLSPSSFKNDRIAKKEIYLQFGVTEYWIVDPIYQSVEVFNIENDDYVLKQFIVESGEIESKVLEGFKMDIKAIFETQNTLDEPEITEGVENNG